MPPIRLVVADMDGTLLDDAHQLSAGTLAKFRAAFLSALSSDSLAKGTQIYFGCKGESLSIGEGSPSARATLKEKGVCSALFDTYFGKSPVSPAAKDGVAAGFASRRFYMDE